MIERIFIPTVHRADNQITYNNLPDKYKKIVTMVVQAWERPLYNYDCDKVSEKKMVCEHQHFIEKIRENGRVVINTNIKFFIGCFFLHLEM